jgi:hypothetical protein
MKTNVLMRPRSHASVIARERGPENAGDAPPLLQLLTARRPSKTPEKLMRPIIGARPQTTSNPLHCVGDASRSPSGSGAVGQPKKAMTSSRRAIASDMPSAISSCVKPASNSR